VNPPEQMSEEQIRIVQLQVDAIAEPVTLLALFLLYVHREDVDE
jgi:hypothetical protein